jgi:hypothetical protein
MTQLSVKIMAHQKRAPFIPHLLEQLGLEKSDVIWDRKNNRWDTGRRAWQAIDQGAEWGMVVQDDALVCRDLIAGLESALDFLPETGVVSPYIGTRRPAAGKVERAVMQARDLDASWIKMPSLNWGVAIILPTEIINELIKWCDKQQYPQYDRRVGRCAIDLFRLNTWCPWPSLVDHRDGESLVGHGQGRKAHEFIGEDASALGRAWNKGFINMGESTRVASRRFPARPQADASLELGSPATYNRMPFVATNRQATALRVPKRVGMSYDEPPRRPTVDNQR